MKEIINTICTVLKNNEPLVLATILAQDGSTPRTAGAKMVIKIDGTIAGTIGGGLVEAKVMELAPEVLDAKIPRVEQYDLFRSANADSMDLICGGRMDVLIEPIAPTRENREAFEALKDCIDDGKNGVMVSVVATEKAGLPGHCLIHEDNLLSGDRSFCSPSVTGMAADLKGKTTPQILDVGNATLLFEPVFSNGTVYIFGAGHVSRALADLTRMVDFKTIVLDDRAEYANAKRFGTAEEVVVLESFDNVFDGIEIDENSYVVIVTRGHTHDKTVLAQTLSTRAGYIGMIGSRNKRNIIYNTLKKEGVAQADIDRVHSPIGLAISAQTPAEIAVSIVGELIQERVKIMETS